MDNVNYQIVENYTDKYPNSEKQIAILMEADEANKLNKETLEFLLNDEDDIDMIEILESYLKDNLEINGI